MIEEAKGGIGCAGVGGDGQLDARAGAGDTLPPVLPPPGPPDACPPRRLPAARRIPPAESPASQGRPSPSCPARLPRTGRHAAPRGTRARPPALRWAAAEGPQPLPPPAVTTRARAEDVGPSAVEGGLAGLGRGWYTELLLGAGWPGDCAEAGAGRIPRPISRFRVLLLYNSAAHLQFDSRQTFCATLHAAHVLCTPPGLHSTLAGRRQWPRTQLARGVADLAALARP